MSKFHFKNFLLIFFITITLSAVCFIPKTFAANVKEDCEPLLLKSGTGQAFTSNFLNTTEIISKGNGEDETTLLVQSFVCIDSYGQTNKNILKELLNNVTISSMGFGVDPDDDDTLSPVILKYQEIQKLDPDYIVGVETSFSLGHTVSQTGKVMTNTGLCRDVDITFTPANYIAQDTEAGNKENLKKVLNCLTVSSSNNLEDGTTANSTVIEILENIKDDSDYKFLKDNLYDNSGKKAAVAVMFDLGRLYGLAGGKYNGKREPLKLSQETQDILEEMENNKNEEDPCARYYEYEKKGNLVPKMTFGQKVFPLVPQAPGTLNWQNLSLDEFLGGSTGEDDGLKGRDECVVGIGIWAAIVWKAVLFFEGLLGILALAMLLYGGYRYLTAHGEEESMNKAKTSIIWSIIGIFLVIVSRLITEVLLPRNENSILLDQEKFLSEQAAAPAFEAIIGITNWILGFTASIIVLMIIYGGYMLVIARGDDSLEEKGKNILKNSLIGLIIIIIAYSLVITLFEATSSGIS